MKKLTRERVAPMIPASVSWLVFGITVWGAFRNGDHRFLALLPNDDEPRFAFENIEDRIRRVTLREDNPVLAVVPFGVMG